MAKAPYRVWLVAAVLALVTLALYWPVTGYDFVNYDDPVYFSENAHVLAGLTWHNLAWAFQTTLDASWYPVSWLSFMLDAELFGRGPAGPHLMNVLIHAANGVLLFLLWGRMTGSLWRSALVAALFLVHPLHVESVAWVSERKDVLSGFFGLLALIAYARYAECRMQNVECRMQKPEPEGPGSVVRGPSTLRGAATEDGGAGASRHCHRTASRPRLAAAANAQGRSELFRAPCRFQRAASRGRLAVRRWAVSIHGGSVEMRPRGSVSSLPASIFYLLSFFLFALGLMSKPMLVTWPFVMLLLDYWPLRRMQNEECRMKNANVTDTQHATRLTAQSPIANRQLQILFSLLLEKLPFLLLAVIASAVTVIVHKQEGAITPLASIPLSARIANAFVSYARYLGQMCWPTDLAVPYLHPGHWPLGAVFLGVALVAGFSAVSLWLGHRRPYLLVGWFWFLGTLVPVIGLIQWGNQAMADRFLYVPSVGLFVALAWGIGTCASSLSPHEERVGREMERGESQQNAPPLPGPLLLPASGGEGEMLRSRASLDLYKYQWAWGPGALLGRWQLPKVAVASVAALVLLALALRSHDQLRYWRDGETLFRHTLEVTENNYFAHNNLGAVLVEKGQAEEAMRQFREAIRIRPDEVNAHYNLGNVLLKEGQTDAAIAQFQEAARLKPGSALVHYNLGIAFGNKGQTDAAISQFQEAIRLQPSYPEALGSLAGTLAGQGKYAEAIRLYQAALKTQPDQDGILNNLAWLLATCPDAAFRNGPEAVRLATRACELTSYAKPLLVGTLAAAQAEAGDFQAAIATGERAATLADRLHLEQVAAKNRELIQLYRRGQPFHERRGG